MQSVASAHDHTIAMARSAARAVSEVRAMARGNSHGVAPKLTDLESNGLLNCLQWTDLQVTPLAAEELNFTFFFIVSIVLRQIDVLVPPCRAEPKASLLRPRAFVRKTH